ncbi:hypothetical protein C1646_755557 [Rhizophagus diaphanus]|nr:hypothetical protein C1646_755557 [Rhizophagus diaphanus] [Rhizophagus sp. MUCL 43196]
MEITLNCIFLGNYYAFSVKACSNSVIGDKVHVNYDDLSVKGLKYLICDKKDYDYKDHGKFHIIVHVPAATGPFQRGVPQVRDKTMKNINARQFYSKWISKIEFVKDLPYPPIANGPNIDVGIGRTSVALRVLCEYFTSGGNYDYGEFVKICKILKSQLVWHLKDSTAKIDFAVLEGIVPSWPQLVTPLKIKPNIRDKEGTNYYHDAMGQRADRFSLILKYKKIEKLKNDEIDDCIERCTKFCANEDQCRNKWNTLKSEYENLERLLNGNLEGFLTHTQTIHDETFHENSWMSSDWQNCRFGLLEETGIESTDA